MQREKFLIIIHIEYGLCRVHDPPGDGDSDFNGIAQAVVDLLSAVVQSHDLQGELVAFNNHVCSHSLCRAHQNRHAAAGFGHVSALAQPGLCRRVHPCAEGIYKIKAAVLQRSHIFTK